jgi:hypothetical protein
VLLGGSLDGQALDENPIGGSGETHAVCVGAAGAMTVAMAGCRSLARVGWKEANEGSAGPGPVSVTVTVGLGPMILVVW